MRSPPVWQTLGTLSPWCSWTARLPRTSSTASRAAGLGHALPAATPWTALPRSNGAAYGGDPLSSKSKSPTWRTWMPSIAGLVLSSRPFSHYSTWSIGSTMSDPNCFWCSLLFDFDFHFICSFSFFSVAFVPDGTCRVKDCNRARLKRKNWLKDYYVLDQVLIEIVFYIYIHI